MNLNRSEQNQTERALRKGNREREERVSVMMGKEEAQRVEAAITEAMHVAAVNVEHAQREAQERELGRLLVVAIPAIDQGIESGIAQERARCLAICAQWPDNLMAAHIAKMIASGK